MLRTVAMGFSPYDLLGYEEAGEPACGEFCDACGDCLRCYGGDDCGTHGDWGHTWVRYIETPGEANVWRFTRSGRRLIVLDREGVTVLPETAVPDDRVLWDGLRLPVEPSRSSLVEMSAAHPIELAMRVVTATFEQFRGDGVAIFRRAEA